MGFFFVDLFYYKNSEGYRGKLFFLSSSSLLTACREFTFDLNFHVPAWVAIWTLNLLLNGLPDFCPPSPHVQRDMALRTFGDLVVSIKLIIGFPCCWPGVIILWSTDQLPPVLLLSSAGLFRPPRPHWCGPRQFPHDGLVAFLEGVEFGVWNSGSPS